MNAPRTAVAGGLAAALVSLAPGAALADGAALYVRHCSVCHQAKGVGLDGVYPRLAGRAADLARRPDGRQLMMAAALNGMAGKLEVDGKPLMGIMPGFAQLSDQDLAEVLTYVAGLGGKAAPAFAPAELAAARASARMSPTAVNALARTVRQR